MREHDWEEEHPYTEHDYAPPVDRGVLCITCKYQLEGLSPDSRCPECGTIVGYSLERQSAFGFGLSAPEHVRAVHGAFRLTFWALIAQGSLGIVGGFAVAGINMATGGASGSGRMSTQASTAQVVTQIIGVLLAFVVLTGWWRLSTPDPGVDERHDAGRARASLRMLSAISFVTVVLSSIAAYFLQQNTQPTTPNSPFGFQGSAQFGSLFIGLLLVGLLGVLVGALQLTAAVFYLRWLGWRVPSPRVERLASTCVWLVPVLATVGIVACGLGPLAAMILVLVMLWMLKTDMAPFVPHAHDPRGY